MMNRSNAAGAAAPTADERRRMIELAAYYLAEHRGFAPGGADADWLRAERAIDALIAGWSEAAAPRNAIGTPGGDVSERIRNALTLGGAHSDRPSSTAEAG